MNKRQRLVLWLSFGLISISSLFAPWRSYPINKHVAPDITIYRAVFLGPPDQIKEIQRDWIYNGVGPGYFGPGYSVAIGGFRIDTTRLFVEWILILLLAGIAFLALKTKSESEQKAEDKENESGRLQREEQATSRIKQRELRKELNAKLVLNLRRWHRRLIWIAIPAVILSCIVLPYHLIWRGSYLDGGYSIGQDSERDSPLGYFLVSTEPSIRVALYSRRNFFSIGELPKRQKRGYEFVRDSLDSAILETYSPVQDNSNPVSVSVNVPHDSNGLMISIRSSELTASVNSRVSQPSSSLPPSQTPAPPKGVNNDSQQGYGRYDYPTTRPAPAPRTTPNPDDPAPPGASLNDLIRSLYPNTASPQPADHQNDDTWRDSIEYHQMLIAERERIANDAKDVRVQDSLAQRQARITAKVESEKSHWLATRARISQDSIIFIRDSLATEVANFYKSVVSGLQAGVKIDSGAAFIQISIATLLLIIAIAGRQSRKEAV